MNSNTSSVEFSQNNCLEKVKFDQPKDQVELFTSIVDSNCKPDINYSISGEILTKKSKQQTSIGETNHKHGGLSKIDFDKSFVIDYYFEMKQTLKLYVKEESNVIAEVETTVGKIMGSKSQQSSFPFTGNNGITGQILVRGVPVKENDTNLILGIQAKFENSNVKPFFVIKRNSSNVPGEINWIAAYKSEVLQDYPKVSNFGQVCLSTQFLTNGNLDQMPVLVEFFDYSNPKQPIGGYCSNLNKLVENNTQTVALMSPTGAPLEDKKFLLNSNLSKSYKFLDYIKGGTKISAMIAIDFTASNGNPNETDSLHSVQKVPNLYEMAIDSCVSTIANYDTDQQFPVFGYGAKVDPKNDQVSHCFPINMTNDPNIFQVKGILDCYRNCIQNSTIKLHGPTHFAPIIKLCTQIAKNVKNYSTYSILMILTDGMINDWEETTDAVVEASKYPLSIIIVGIGKDEDEMFPEMRELDSDHKKLVNSQGTPAIRDIVQFVEFDKLGNDPKVLSEKVLEEIPRQVEEFYRIVNIPPVQPS